MRYVLAFLFSALSALDGASAHADPINGQAPAPVAEQLGRAALPALVPAPGGAGRGGSDVVSLSNTSACAGCSEESNDRAFRTALAAIAGVGGGTLTIPCGRFALSGGLAYAGGALAIRGSGTCTELHKSTLTGDLFSFRADNVSLSDLVVTTDQADKGGTIFNFESGGNNVLVSNLLVNGGYDVLTLPAGAAGTLVVNATFDNFTHNGVWLKPGYGGGAYLANLNMNVRGDAPESKTPPNEVNSGTGLLIEGGDTFNLANVGITATRTPIVVRPPAGGFVRNLFAINVQADGVGRATSGPGWTLDGRTGEVSRILCTNCWGSTMADDGFLVAGVDTFNCTSCVAVTNVKHGFEFEPSPTATQVTIADSLIAGNSIGHCGQADGIYLGPFHQHFRFVHNTIGKSASNSQAMRIRACQRWGINIPDKRGVDYFLIEGNDFDGQAKALNNSAGTGPTRVVANNM